MKTKTVTLDQFKSYCREHKIPILSDEALTFIKSYIKAHDVKNILEIGSAYGYSAICFSQENAHVDTLENDPERISEAEKWIAYFKADVTLYPFDALSFNGLTKTYDIIFIDAAKGQYKKFFEKYQKYLNDDGVIICDNISFHDLKIENVRSRGTKNLLKKIDEFKQFLRSHPDYQTTYMTIGDGLSLSKRIKNG